MKTVDFSETIAASDLKVSGSRHLIEYMKICEYWFKHIYLAKHRTISTITTFVSVRGFERKLQVAYRVHLFLHGIL